MSARGVVHLVEADDELDHLTWLLESCPHHCSGFVDATNVRFSELLLERVLALPEFDDNPDASNEPRLEAILAWIDEYA